MNANTSSGTGRLMVVWFALLSMVFSVTIPNSDWHICLEIQVVWL